MRINDLAFLAVRLLALYLIIQAASILPAHISMAFVPGGDSPDIAMNNAIAFGGLFSGLVLVVFAGILWALSNPLANFMTRGINESGDVKEEINLQNLYAVGITIIGVFIIATSTPRFINSLGYFLSVGKAEKMQVFNALGPVIQMVIGFVCAFKTNVVVSKLKA